MRKYKMEFVMLIAAAGLLTSSPLLFSEEKKTETWRLGEEGQWKAVSAEDKYLLAVADIKKLINTGETKAVGQAVEKLKKDFPEIAGPDLDAFINAEMLYASGEFTKAVRSYDKFLDDFPTSKLYEAALDREFTIATAFLGGQKKKVLGVFKMSRYAEGIKTMERISDRGGNAPIAKKAAVAVAQHYEKRKKFAEAYLKWSEIPSRWPSGQIAKDALLSMARCKHAAYRGPKYDSSDLISAKSYYEDFKLQYPEDAKGLDVDKILKQIDEQLAYKELNTADYYQRTGKWQSANLYYQMVVDNRPGSDAAGKARDAMKNKKEEKPDTKKGKKWREKLKKLLL